VCTPPTRKPIASSRPSSIPLSRNITEVTTQKPCIAMNNEVVGASIIANQFVNSRTNFSMFKFITVKCAPVRNRSLESWHTSNLLNQSTGMVLLFVWQALERRRCTHPRILVTQAASATWTQRESKYSIEKDLTPRFFHVQLVRRFLSIQGIRTHVLRLRFRTSNQRDS
jgi:hypothetical protein